MNHGHHLEEALRVNEYNHALEPEATCVGKFLICRYDIRCVAHFIAEEEAHTEFTFDSSSEVHWNANFFTRFELHWGVTVWLGQPSVEDIENEWMTTEQINVANIVIL